jgi:hypothetical protein
LQYAISGTLVLDFYFYQMIEAQKLTTTKAANGKRRQFGGLVLLQKTLGTVYYVYNGQARTIE